MESDVIREDITSGDAGCIDTRFEECAEGPDRDFRRRDRYGIGGGVSMALCKDRRYRAYYK
ncbi:hypothetical protein SS1G_01142 [Sclerotinia sclerotiorum 1980 UF-70]|uniref:Uncharacterized protein n=1 Tax=Sclerotinia sclerotiorum (strain ATCC 18683 / 1980 / Ss-1) TaxID=665079 RepID=A7E766_SCLS1|nr:hypothetical protein SS1G_01142 [Sclerotinia sclerotiorum 1980 UF-70]EDN96218.1 hypothetical protein SS1G_01142 [Sclerotinia sclerotiorum 1980 UF-70]